VAVGDVIVVRYADDLVVGFESRAEAERFLSEFRERLAKFGLVGFTHYYGKRRSDGSFIVWRKTAKKRMVAKLRALKAELTRRSTSQ
jgi:hypothetical protein